MIVQIRYEGGKIENKEINNTVDFIEIMESRYTETVVKMSFDFLDGSRLVLRNDGTFNIYGTLVNFPRIS